MTKLIEFSVEAHNSSTSKSFYKTENLSSTLKLKGNTLFMLTITLLLVTDHSTRNWNKFMTLEFVKKMGTQFL